MKILLLSMPDSFEHMPPIAVRMPNGGLTSIAGNVLQQKFLDIWNDSPEMNDVRSIRLKDLQGCPSCSNLSTCTRCPGLAYMDGNMRGPSATDCEKSFARSGVWSANMVRKFSAIANHLVQIRL